MPALLRPQTALTAPVEEPAQLRYSESHAWLVCLEETDAAAAVVTYMKNKVKSKHILSESETGRCNGKY